MRTALNGKLKIFIFFIFFSRKINIHKRLLNGYLKCVMKFNVPKNLLLCTFVFLIENFVTCFFKPFSTSNSYLTLLTSAFSIFINKNYEYKKLLKPYNIKPYLNIFQVFFIFFRETKFQQKIKIKKFFFLKFNRKALRSKSS